MALAVICAGCSNSDVSLDAPVSAQGAARVISDGVASLSALEAQLAAATANEPRRAAPSDAESYFVAVGSTARQGLRMAAQVRESVASLRTTGEVAAAQRDVLAALDTLSASYAALDGACDAHDVAAVRRARQTIATAMEALHQAAPHLGG